MKVLIDAKFRGRNSEEGLIRFLAGKGFDMKRKIMFKPGPTKMVEWATQSDSRKKK